MIDLKRLEATNFEGFNKYIDRILKIFESTNAYESAESLCYVVASHYKYLAQIDGIREDCRKYAKEWLDKGDSYKKQLKGE